MTKDFIFGFGKCQSFLGKCFIFVNWKIFTTEEEQIIEPPKSTFELWENFIKYSLLVRMWRVKWLELSICQHSYNYTKHRLALKLHHTNSFKIMIPNQALKPWNCARFWRSCSKVSFTKKIVAVKIIRCQRQQRSPRM